jgi:hypothetical protein
MGIDPWGKKLLGPKGPGRVRPTDIYLGCLGIDVFVDRIDTDFYIRLRESNVMELLAVNDYSPLHLLARRPYDPSVPQLAQFMQVMCEVFIAWSNFQGPVYLSKAGLLKQRDWRELQRRLEEGTRRKDKSEFDDRFGLLKLADELNMQAIHAGGKSELFIGRCPAHDLHHIHLNPEKGNWMCGWCGVNGGVEELKRFHEKHRS